MTYLKSFGFHFEALYFEDQQRIFWHFRHDYVPNGDIRKTSNRTELYSLYSHEDIRTVRKLSCLAAMYAHRLFDFEGEKQVIGGLLVQEWHIFHDYRLGINLLDPADYRFHTPIDNAPYWFTFSYFGLMDLEPIFLKYDFTYPKELPPEDKI